MLTEFLASIIAVIIFSKIISSFLTLPFSKLPPGPIRWPILGSLLELQKANPKYPHLAFSNLAKKYGDVISFGYGVHFAVLVSSYEAMKDIFTLNEVCLSRYNNFPYIIDRNFHKNLGIIWSSDIVWKEMRRYTLRIFRGFGFGKVSMDSIMIEESEKLVSYIRSSVNENNGVLEVNPDYFSVSSINILWKVVGSFNFQYGDEKLRKVIKQLDDLLEIMGHKSSSFKAFPFFQTWFPKWSQFERNMETNKAVQSMMRDMIAEVKSRKLERMDSEPENFIESFLYEMERHSNDPETLYTEEQLIVLLMDLFLGGSKTSPTTLNWAILYLVLNPEVQQKLQKEIAEELNTENVSINDFKSVPYMRATIYEIFRITALIPTPSPRKAMADIKYKNFVIPKGTAIYLNLTPVLRDKNFWGDPEVFRPERFLNKDGTTLLNEYTDRVPVFGFGKRICLAETMAWNILFMWFVAIFRNFSFEAIPGQYPSPDEPNYSIILAPRRYCVKVHFRM